MPTITPDFWPQCIERLAQELSSQQINMWVRPLQPEFKDDQLLVLWAPNRFVLDMVAQQLKAKILDQAQMLLNRPMLEISLQVGSAQTAAPPAAPMASTPRASHLSQPQTPMAERRRIRRP